MKGIFSALLVPYDEEGNIKEEGLRQLVRYNIDVCGVDGLYVGGSTGENFMLSTDEKKKIFEIVKDEAKEDVKLIAQVGSINLKESVELGKFATELGYDSLSAVTPFYYKFDFEEIKNYYETIINATNNNMIIYSIPFLTGVNITLNQFGELFKNEKIIGVKFTQGDFYLLERLRKTFPDKLIFSGFDEMLLPAVISGVDGAIGSTYNVNGKRAKEIFKLGQAGKVKEAYEIQHVTNDLIEGILSNGLYQTIKEILKVKGVDAGYCRQPMKRLTDEKINFAKELAEKYL
ncbi:N-acetylneuraminate lyase [Clostridium massiliodielmoense]|uniref:N-acetylneuraminate lyase n=1 Tax=Clostridium massiliodielmoense TaxID=1776385 RepID=UPI000166A6ED|nr:N-acetylneuraminate lyase [Clostridium massiliodielmoense]EDS78491.1 N-acetylneuraminate lyase [Clostridium botulinum C str. Eklund]KEH98835.1 N-acetylneuraminate lyase [Clostridium botulinum C/D str. BKT12695]NEZ48154.1 N-acetylneuraminate lyase [Clostridium botulinum]